MIFQIQEGVVSNSFNAKQQGFDNVSYIEQVGKAHISQQIDFAINTNARFTITFHFGGIVKKGSVVNLSFLRLFLILYF